MSTNQTVSAHASQRRLSAILRHLVFNEGCAFPLFLRPAQKRPAQIVLTNSTGHSPVIHQPRISSHVPFTPKFPRTFPHTHVFGPSPDYFVKMVRPKLLSNQFSAIILILIDFAIAGHSHQRKSTTSCLRSTGQYRRNDGHSHVPDDFEEFALESVRLGCERSHQRKFQ